MTNNTPDYEDNLYFEEKKMNCKHCPYTDEYCASGDCNEIQAKDVACNKISLTEQWKKGELPSGWYYIKLWKGCNVIDYFIGNQFLRYDDSDIDEILTPLPSYDEWMNTQKEIQKKAYELGNLGYKIKNQRKEIERQIAQNAQLKELLKRVNEHFKWVDKDDPFYVEDKLWDDIKKVLEKKGNEVLK